MHGDTKTFHAGETSIKDLKCFKYAKLRVYIRSLFSSIIAPVADIFDFKHCIKLLLNTWISTACYRGGMSYLQMSVKKGKHFL